MSQAPALISLVQVVVIVVIVVVVVVKMCGKVENDEAKSGNDKAKGVPGR